MHLPEVCRKLRLLVPAAGYVLMRTDHLTPRGETSSRLVFNGCSRGPAPLRARLLVEAHAQQFHLHVLDLTGLRRGDRRQEPVGRIKSPVSIVAGKRLPDAPSDSALPVVRSQGSARLASEGISENVVPRLPHDPQKPRSIHVGESVFFASCDRLSLGLAAALWFGSWPLWWLMNSRDDEWRKPGLECVHRTTYSVSIGYCHAFLSRMLFCEWAATPELCRYGVMDRTGLGYRPCRVCIGVFRPIAGVPRFHCPLRQLG